jgi:tryptophan-rich sensory protein
MRLLGLESRGCGAGVEKRLASRVAFAQVPYFVWVSIAAVLQLSITAMNR